MRLKSANLFLMSSLAWLWPMHLLLGQTPATPISVTQASEYHLQAGDKFEILYRYTPEFNQTVAILPDGDVDLQIAGSIRAQGLTVSQLHDAIAARIANTLRHTDFAISLKDFVANKIVVLGEVNSPGRFDIHGPITVLDAIALGGGFKTTASQSTVVLVHRLDDTYARVDQLDFTELKKKDKRVTMPEMQPGDTVIVSSSKLARVERIVRLSNVGLYYPLP
jgi:polysaccharide export outer membrane protein